MKIEILGPGCIRCKTLAQNAETAATTLGIPCDIVKVTDVRRMREYKVMFTPALVVNGEVKCAGRIATPPEIQTWITSALDAEPQR